MYELCISSCKMKNGRISRFLQRFTRGSSNKISRSDRGWVRLDFQMFERFLIFQRSKGSFSTERLNFWGKSDLDWTINRISTSVQLKFDWGLALIFERFNVNCWPCDLTTKSERHVGSTWGQTSWFDKIGSTLLKIVRLWLNCRRTRADRESNRTGVHLYCWSCVIRDF
jgi:hypothetical protein